MNFINVAPAPARKFNNPLKYVLYFTQTLTAWENMSLLLI